MAWEPLEHVRIEGEFLSLSGGEVWDRVENAAWQRREFERAHSAEKRREFRSRQHGRLYHRNYEKARRVRGKERLARIRACKQCGKTFALTATQVGDLKKRLEHSGRFCSRRCFGRFNRARTDPRPTRMVTIDGKTRPLPAWAAHFGLCVSVVYARIREGMSEVEALMKPKGKRARKPRLVTVNGITKTLPEWAAEYGVSAESVYRRMRAGMSEAEALVPIRRSRKRAAA